MGCRTENRKRRRSPSPRWPWAWHLGLCQVRPVLCSMRVSRCPLDARLHGDRLSHLHFLSLRFAAPPSGAGGNCLPLSRTVQRNATAPPPSCRLPSPTPQAPGTTPTPAPPPAALRPPPCGPRGISCQRPWSRSPSPGLSPSHSRAAESFEKNAAGREGLLRTERLCGGNCCSALSPPRPPGGAALSAANAKPGARSPAGRSRTGQGGRGAEEAPGGGGGVPRPPPASPPHPTGRGWGPDGLGRRLGTEGQQARGLSPHCGWRAGTSGRSLLLSRVPRFGEWTHEVPGPWLRPRQHTRLGL